MGDANKHAHGVQICDAQQIGDHYFQAIFAVSCQEWIVLAGSVDTGRCIIDEKPRFHAHGSAIRTGESRRSTGSE